MFYYKDEKNGTLRCDFSWQATSYSIIRFRLLCLALSSSLHAIHTAYESLNGSKKYVIAQLATCTGNLTLQIPTFHHA